ncbi:hypothetical protein E2C01_027626 [Portunus trituberculatus]|uniref:Uncharacterized protein n=1 Tax=Portunus trituberculatus TaxID=210409 RepID=A0A5B7EJ75_PORTR|nr:hypothetical protein [Portunus trituberculatus]
MGVMSPGRVCGSSQAKYKVNSEFASGSSRVRSSVLSSSVIGLWIYLTWVSIYQEIYCLLIPPFHIHELLRQEF